MNEPLREASVLGAPVYERGFWGGTRALVTGGGGFLGGAVVDALRGAGCAEIAALGRSPRPDLERAGIEYFRGDLAEPAVAAAACVGRGVVVHCAAKAGVWGCRSEYYAANVTATENLLAAARGAGARAFVHVSSPSVAYPPTREIRGVDESIVPPASYLAYYPETKMLAERLALAADGGGGMRVAALRPHLIWGPGDPHLLPRLVARAKAGRLARVGDGRALVDMTYVDHAAAACVLAAERLATTGIPGGKPYFISDDSPVNLWDWIDELLAKLEIPPPRRRISYRAAYLVGGILELVFGLLRLPGEPPMTRFVAGQLAFSHYFNIANAKVDLGYQPFIDQRPRMERTIAWLKENITAAPK